MDALDKDSCCLCGRNGKEPIFLIQGPYASVCKDCVLQAHNIIQRQQQSSTNSENFSFELKTPKEIKSFLDGYVIGQDKAKKPFA